MVKNFMVSSCRDDAGACCCARCPKKLPDADEGAVSRKSSGESDARLLPESFRLILAKFGLSMPGALPFRAWPRPVGEALSLPDSLLPAFELVAVPAGSCAGAMRRGLRQGTIRIIMPEMRQKVEKKGGSVSFRASFECSGREDEVSAACEVRQGHRSQAF
ncbi:hypothetical protein [Mailhella massiliensis]|uniref:hypothetical protein n=1 Tax=Mailhella massiliensis TaxID=1903261 RepID=UPI0011866E87|nr:hypothetical protein [Mailhella massiliensis]